MDTDLHAFHHVEAKTPMVKLTGLTSAGDSCMVMVPPLLDALFFLFGPAFFSLLEGSKIDNSLTLLLGRSNRQTTLTDMPQDKQLQHVEAKSVQLEAKRVPLMMLVFVGVRLVFGCVRVYYLSLI